MKVQSILKGKKNVAVLTIQPEDTILKLVQRLRTEEVGAMIVSRDERDVVRALAVNGGKVLSLPVSAIMTRA
jgi:hypothetical protein